MIEEKELYREPAEAIILGSGYQDTIWAEDLFDVSIVPYSGKLKAIPEYSQIQPRLELYGLIIVRHRSREIQIVEARADISENRLYISENLYRSHWHDIRESIAGAMEGRHIASEPASCVDRSLLKRNKPAQPQVQQADSWERRKQSLLDNRECLFYYGENGESFHDRDCRELHKINPQKFQASKMRPEGMAYCPRCAYRLYARIACYPVGKEIDAVEHFVRRHHIGQEQWMIYVEDFGMRIHITSLSEVRVSCHEDSWIIRVSENREMSLWHNNYIRTDDGGRYITGGFHEQGFKSKNLKFLLDVIGRYDWTAYHVETDACDEVATPETTAPLIPPSVPDELSAPREMPAQIAQLPDDAGKAERRLPVIQTLFDKARANPITQSIMARLEELRQAGKTK